VSSKSDFINKIFTYKNKVKVVSGKRLRGKYPLIGIVEIGKEIN